MEKNISRQVKGKAKLLSYTENPEQTIALAARLCYSEESPDALADNKIVKEPKKFIEALKKMGHLSTFEHASFTFSITGVSRALLAQITRHRIASFSVKSQRYVSEGDFKYILPPAIKALGKEAEEKFNSQMDTISKWYIEWQEALGGKSEKSNEDARFVLPNACETNMLLTMNARELLHFFSLRLCYRAQWEIREVAKQMLKEVLKVAPNVFEGVFAPCITSKCPEGSKSCGRKADAVKEYKDLM